MPKKSITRFKQVKTSQDKKKQVKTSENLC